MLTVQGEEPRAQSKSHAWDGLNVAVVIPCYNEAVSIGKVVADFREYLPDATIYVCDNNSKDATKEEAQRAGAIVLSENMQGKGHVVRRMFADVEADIYVMVDGDDTYDAPSAPVMVRMLVEQQLDMVVGARVTEDTAAYRPMHRLGNALLSSLIRRFFGSDLSDIMTGLRVFSRRYVKSFPILSASGFNVDPAFSTHALELRMPIAELKTPYRARPPGSESKLRTYADGWRVIRAILLLVEDERPLQFFGLTGLMLGLAGLACGILPITEFLHMSYVKSQPLAMLATGLMLLAFLSLVCGLVLDSVSKGRKEAKRLLYLSIPGIGARRRALITEQRLGPVQGSGVSAPRGFPGGRS